MYLAFNEIRTFEPQANASVKIILEHGARQHLTCEHSSHHCTDLATEFHLSKSLLPIDLLLETGVIWIPKRLSFVSNNQARRFYKQMNQNKTKVTSAKWRCFNFVWRENGRVFFSCDGWFLLELCFIYDKSYMIFKCACLLFLINENLWPQCTNF